MIMSIDDNPIVEYLRHSSGRSEAGGGGKVSKHFLDLQFRIDVIRVHTFLWNSVSQTGFHRTLLGVPREIVEYIHSEFETPQKL
jgi:hypothetical protein